MATVIGTKALFSLNPSLSFHPEKPILSPNRITFSLLPLSLHSPKPYSLSLRPIVKKSNKIIACSSSSCSSPTIPNCNQSSTIVADSTRTISTIAALAFALSTAFITSVRKLSGQVLEQNVVGTVGPLFFASLRDRPSGYLNTPLTVVAAGLSKWLEIYSGVLMVRVLLSWFPNIPWDRQPLSAIRDLCDPYLNLFRNIIPPIFDTLDVSPLLAFAVLGTLGSILNNSRGMY